MGILCFLLLFSVFLSFSVFSFSHISSSLGVCSVGEGVGTVGVCGESLGVCSVGEGVGTVGVCGGFGGGVICVGYWKGDCIIITGGC